MTWHLASGPAELRGSSQPISISLARVPAPPLPSTGRRQCSVMMCQLDPLLEHRAQPACPVQESRVHLFPVFLMFIFLRLIVYFHDHEPQSVLCLQSNRQPVKLNLLTCQVKPSPEDRKCFDLISRRFCTIDLSLHVKIT